MNLTRLAVLAAVLFAPFVAVPSSLAAGTPEQQCQAAKNKVAGKYTACCQGAEAKFATSNDLTRYLDALTKCGTKLTSAWQKAIDKAAAAGAICLDDPLTVGDFKDVIDAHIDNVATALAGGGLQDCPADLATCEAALSACEALPGGGVLKTGQMTTYGTGSDGDLQKGVARSYTDNGDGTITDHATGLMWEKLSDDGSIHDKDNVYTWTDAFAMKIATLNSSTFAGYSDWRLPNIKELQSIVHFGTTTYSVDEVFKGPCPGGCTVTTCSCVRGNFYWSSTTYEGNPLLAWFVGFLDGLTYWDPKTANHDVRGVRGGM